MPSFSRSILRLDACFGEWLTPEYFETITPPPSSVMMLGTAKAELLRRENYKSYLHFHAHTQSSPSGGQLWTSASLESRNRKDQDAAPLENISATETVPASSGDALSDRLAQMSVSCASRQKAEPLGYIPPSLSYPASNNGPIPQGLVAHARDACLEIDYQWDSMCESINWGDGGAYGEEWTAMHKRFRNSLQSLVYWYSTSDNPGEMVTKTITSPRISLDASECAVEDDDLEYETVVVIVSHGAGCNALIGAITRKPVLMDVGLASLTYATRRDSSRMKNLQHLTGDGIVPLNEVYDLKIFANTDHLRSSMSTIPNERQLPSMASIFNGNRGRFASNLESSNLSNRESPAGRSFSANAALASYPSNGKQSALTSRTQSLDNASEGSTVRSSVTGFMKNSMTPSGLAISPSIGLWSPFRPCKEEEQKDDEEDTMLLNFSHEKTSWSPATQKKSGTCALPNKSRSSVASAGKSEVITSELVETGDHLPSEAQLAPGGGIGGLWGNPTPQPPHNEDGMHNTLKRRWTVNERGLQSDYA